MEPKKPKIARGTVLQYEKLTQAFSGASSDLRQAMLTSTPELANLQKSLQGLSARLYSRYGDKRASLGGPASAFGGDTVKAGPGQLGRNTFTGGGFEDYMRVTPGGELVGARGQQLPPLTSHSTIPDILSRQPTPRYSGPAFAEGFQDTIDTGRSFLQRTPQSTTGMNLGQRLRYAAGRAAGDVASDASRTQYWRFNHPYAIAREGLSKLAGDSKLGGALASFAGIQAIGQTSGAFDLGNPGQAFRPKGMQAAYPSDKNLTQPENPLKELAGRYLFGRGGKLLPFDQFSQERPDVSRETYDKYDRYLKARPDAMPAGTFDLGGFGVLKGTSEGINGPEIRFAGTPVTPGSVVAGVGTAAATAGVYKAANAARLGVVPKPGPTVRVAGRSVQLGRTNPAIAIGSALVAGGSELQGAQRDRAGVVETIGRVALSPITTVLGGIVQPFQKAAADTARTADLWGKTLTGQKLPSAKDYYAAEESANVARDRSWAEAPKNIVRGILGQPAQAATKSDVVPKSESAPDRAYRESGDRLAKASAERKLVFQGGKVVSVARAPGDMEGIRGVVTKVDDGDTYRTRVYNRDTKQFEEKSVRVGNIDSRETADHASGPGFTNRMIGKQQKEQGFTSEGAVFRQGAKDKAAAEKLVPVGAVVELRNIGEAAHGRMAATVGQEGSSKDVGGSLVASGNAIKYEKKSGGAGGGISSVDRIKVAELQHGKGGSSDRANQSKVKIADLQFGKGGSTDRTNQTKLKVADMTTGRALEGTKYKADATVKVADVTGIRRIQQEVVKQTGQNQTADTTGRYKVKVADTTGRYKLGTEQVKQAGQIKSAIVKGEATLGVAGINAEGKVQVADTTGRYKLGTESVKQSGQISTQQAKNQGAIGLAGAKAESAKTAYIMKSNDQKDMTRDQRQFAADTQARQARIAYSAQAQRGEQRSREINQLAAQTRARDAQAAAFREGQARYEQTEARLAAIAEMGEYRTGSKRKMPKLWS